MTNRNKTRNEKLARDQVQDDKIVGYHPERKIHEQGLSCETGKIKWKAQGPRPLSKYSERRVARAVEGATRQSEYKVNGDGEPYIYNKLTSTQDNICDGSHGALILRVHRGTRIAKAHYCADCKALEQPTWRYQDSNYGLVYLCGLCKTAAFERTFGHADAMPLKVNHAHAHKGKW